MDIKNIRSKLRRLEDTICISLFERSQFKLNKVIYEPEGVYIPNSKLSFFEYLFTETEKVHASAGRYIDPEEHSFFIKNNEPLIPRRKDNDVKIESVVNLNKSILSTYMSFLPGLCQEGDDNDYGSAAVSDINCLQAISRRIHMGEQVAQAKYLEDPKGYDTLIANEDKDAIIKKLTNISVEHEILARTKEKAIRYNLSGKKISEFYEKKVIPLTTKVEVLYFLNKRKN